MPLNLELLLFGTFVFFSLGACHVYLYCPNTLFTWAFPLRRPSFSMVPPIYNNFMNKLFSFHLWQKLKIHVNFQSVRTLNFRMWNGVKHSIWKEIGHKMETMTDQDMNNTEIETICVPCSRSEWKLAHFHYFLVQEKWMFSFLSLHGSSLITISTATSLSILSLLVVENFY